MSDNDKYNVKGNIDVLKLLPSKTKPKRKPMPTNVSSNERGATVKGPNQTPKATLTLTTALTPSQTKPQTKPKAQTRQRKNKVSDEEKRRKRLFKEEMKAAKRRDAENKRIEKQIIEEEKRRKLMIENRRNAIIADRLKQKAINESNDNNSNGITTQMGSFKMKNSVKDKVNNNVINDEIALIPLGNGGFKLELNKPKSLISRRIDQYARRELDPSIVPIFNEMLHRKYLQMKINSS